MKNLITAFLLTVFSVAANAQWLPDIIVTNYGTSSIVNGNLQWTISASVNFTPYANAGDTVIGYNMRLCSIRFLNDTTMYAIDNHYPACGASATANVTAPPIWLNAYNGLFAGEKYYAYLAVYYKHNGSFYKYSPVFSFKTNGSTSYCQILGCMEYCRYDGTLVTTTTTTTKIKGKK